jgi:hypothetical protein
MVTIMALSETVRQSAHASIDKASDETVAELFEAADVLAELADGMKRPSTLQEHEAELEDPRIVGYERAAPETDDTRCYGCHRPFSEHTAKLYGKTFDPQGHLVCPSRPALKAAVAPNAVGQFFRQLNDDAAARADIEAEGDPENRPSEKASASLSGSRSQTDDVSALQGSGVPEKAPPDCDCGMFCHASRGGLVLPLGARCRRDSEKAVDPWMQTR